MTKYPGETPKAGDPKPMESNAPKPSQAKSKPGLPLTKAERAQRMRIDKMVIKRMRKR